MGTDASSFTAKPVSDAFDLFPGFKVAPTDPSRDLTMNRKTMFLAPLPEQRDEDDEDRDWEGERYCDTCCNTGSLDCHCGGDLCVCRNNGEYPCPDCDNY